MYKIKLKKAKKKLRHVLEKKKFSAGFVESKRRFNR